MEAGTGASEAASGRLRGVSSRGGGDLPTAGWHDTIMPGPQHRVQLWDSARTAALPMLLDAACWVPRTEAGTQGCRMDQGPGRESSCIRLHESQLGRQ